jgi:ribosomal protein L40E
LGFSLTGNEEKSGKKILFQICLKCGTKNEAEEIVCRKCGQPLGTPQFSRKRKALEIIAAFAIFIVLLLLVLFVFFYWILKYVP